MSLTFSVAWRSERISGEVAITVPRRVVTVRACASWPKFVTLKRTVPGATVVR